MQVIPPSLKATAKASTSTISASNFVAVIEEFRDKSFGNSSSISDHSREQISSDRDQDFGCLDSLATFRGIWSVPRRPLVMSQTAR